MGLYNPKAQQGATFTRVLTYKNPDGTPINLTGYTARMMLKRAVTDSSPVLSLTSSSGIALGGALGTVTITITATQTADLLGEYVYDLELVNGATVTRLIEGYINFSAEVTK